MKKTSKGTKNEIKLYITSEQNGFDMLTRNISRNKFLTDGAKSLYIYLNSHNENFNLSIQSIANYLNKGIATIKRKINELKQSGFLILEKKEKSNAYYYKLLKSPKIERLKEFTKENIIKSFFENNISFEDINQLRKNKKITLKEYNEILDYIYKIAKTEWVKND